MHRKQSSYSGSLSYWPLTQLIFFSFLAENGGKKGNVKDTKYFNSWVESDFKTLDSCYYRDNPGPAAA